MNLALAGGTAQLSDCSVPYGYCQCGCGEKTTLSRQNHRERGWVKGEPKRFMKGHGTRGAGAGYKEDENGCWIWQGHITSHGYGSGTYTWAHREVWEKHRGSIPDGLQLDHLCSVRACVNPEHLEPVTAVENIRRGMTGSCSRTFSPQAIKAIRCSRMSCAQLGSVFGASSSTIHLIKTRKTYKEVA